MKTTAFIYLKSDSIQTHFEWLDFDGDDCFDEFHIDVITARSNRRFSFGACVVGGLRQDEQFLQG
jgi:hypothetical protein